MMQNHYLVDVAVEFHSEDTITEDEEVVEALTAGDVPQVVAGDEDVVADVSKEEEEEEDALAGKRRCAVHLMA